MISGIQLRRIRVVGPQKPPKDISFGPGLNVLYGGSNTGKSHLVGLIDFVFGARAKPTIPPEGEGYDGVMISIQLSDDTIVTLSRALAGGGIRVVPGMIDAWPAETDGDLYTEQHGRGRSLSEYLLKILKMDGKRLRTNAAGKTRELSFRDLIHLFAIDETKIQSKVSPIESGQVMLKTAELSAFKYVLTGIDDGKLETVRPKSDSETRKQIELEFVDQEIVEIAKTLEISETDQSDLSDQKARLDSAFDREFSSLSEIETPYRDLLGSRRSIRRAIGNFTDRDDEIALLLERFEMLGKHYASDVLRLEAVEEAGSFFLVLDSQYCPLCGAASDHQGETEECEANVEKLGAAVRAEIEKIKTRQTELTATTNRLRTEQAAIPAQLSLLYDSLAKVESALTFERTDVRAAQSRVRAIMEAQTQVEAKLALYSRLDQFHERRKTLVGVDGGDSTSAIAATEIPGSIRSAFETKIEETLRAWQFPGHGRVIFDLRSRDIEINGKPRAANGKGVRAILHSAFSIALVRFCAERSQPQPGFLILDSPLLTYRDPLASTEPQDPLDQTVAQSELRVRVFENLKDWPKNLQLIVVENVDVPDWVLHDSNTTIFTGNPAAGRAGFY